MVASGNEKNPGICQPPIDLLRQGRPLDFAHEIHMCERRVCDFLDCFAENGSSDSSKISGAVQFLKHELPPYLLDEEEDIFPLLQSRCDPDEEIDNVIARLLNDHGHALADAKKIVDILTDEGGNPKPPNTATQTVLRDFATHSRRHLTLGNAIVFPLARLHLTPDDLVTLATRMRERRGVKS